MHYYKRNIGDYAKKAGRLSMLEHGAYTLLIDACYDRERFPTEQEAIDWAWARTEAEVDAVRFVLSRFFALVDGVYVQERIRDEVSAYTRNAENNARIAREREEKRTKRSRSVDGACSSVNEATPNQEPLTTNQEPKDTKPRKPRRQPDGCLSVDDLVAEGVDPQVAKDWMRARKDKGAKTLTQTAWEGVKAEAIKAGLRPGDAVRESAKCGWQGFKASWLLHQQESISPSRPGQAQRETPYAQHMRERVEQAAGSLAHIVAAKAPGQRQREPWEIASDEQQTIESSPARTIAIGMD
jgi:uncharacterized protein YdaU (DUF1376 family)